MSYKWSFNKKEPWLSGLTPSPSDAELGVDNTQAVEHSRRYEKQLKSDDHPRLSEVSSQGTSPSLQGVQGKEPPEAERVAKGHLVKTFCSSTPAPQSVVDEVGKVLDGDVWDYEIARYGVHPKSDSNPS